MSDRGESIRNNVPDSYEKTPGYLVWDISESVGQEMDDIDKDIETVESKLDVSNLRGDELTRFVSQHKGIARKEATHAVGSVTVTGNGIISEGDLFESENGILFEAVENVVVSDVAEVPIRAIVQGNAGIVGAGTITQFPVTISGIITVTNTQATADGYDEEKDEELLGRYLIALRTPPGSGNRHDYRNWALEVTGVGDAQVFPLGHGNNTVDVVIIDADKKPASANLVSAVQNHIDPQNEGKGLGTAPIGAKCYVSSAIAINIDVSAALTLKAGVDEATVKELIETALTEYLKGIAFSSKSASYAQIGNCIIDTEGVLDYENLKVNNGTANIQISDRQVAVLGTVKYD